MTPLKIAAYIIAALVIIIIFRIFSKPLKSILLLSLNSFFGGVGLFIFNTIFSATGFCIGVNAVTAATTGLFGIPGLCLLIILKLMYN